MTVGLNAGGLSILPLGRSTSQRRVHDSPQLAIVTAAPFRQPLSILRQPAYQLPFSWEKALSLPSRPVKMKVEQRLNRRKALARHRFLLTSSNCSDAFSAVTPVVGSVAA